MLKLVAREILSPYCYSKVRNTNTFLWPRTGPHTVVVAGCRVEKCFATSAKTRSNSAYVKFRKGVVCRKCCCKLINKSARVYSIDVTYRSVEVHIKWAVVLTNFKHPFHLTIITIIIPLLHTISAIVFESRETLLWIARYLSFFRKTVAKNYCLQVLLLLSRTCIFLFAVFWEEWWMGVM